MDKINGSSDRVMIHQAMKHLIVGGNASMYMGKDGIKHYPLNRYVVQRDGNGNVIEIVTKELIDKKLVMDIMNQKTLTAVGDDGQKMGGLDDDVEVYTHVKLEGGQWKWYQQVWGRYPWLSWFCS